MTQPPDVRPAARLRALEEKLLAGRLWAAPYVERLDESYVGQWYSRLLELEIIDRSVALASKLFVSFFPFVLGVSSLLPNSVRTSILDSLVDRFGLAGVDKSMLTGAFTSANQTRAATGLFGALLLFFYATSFTTALQRVYLRAWRRPAGGGIKNHGRGLAWLCGVLALFAVNGVMARVLTGGTGGTLRIIGGLATSTLVWWWTAHTMLRGEVRWRPLLPGSLVCGAALLVYVLSSTIWMPRTVASNSAQFGFFGVALAMVSWFLGASFVIIAGAALGPVLVEGDGRLQRWLRRGEASVLTPGALPELPGPTRRLRLIDALGVNKDAGS